MPKPTIAIVVPAFNRAKTIESTLASIASQTRKPERVVLVDNGSSDATLDKMKAWAQEHAGDFAADVIVERKPGACAARNAGLELVEEDWAMFFDSDDTMAPEHVARAMKCLDEHPDAQVVSWDVLMLCGKKKKLKRFPRFDLLFHGIAHGTMSTQMYMARTDVFRRVGAWREEVEVWNDIELGARILMRGGADGSHPIVYRSNGEPTVTVSVHADSITGADYSTKGAAREHSIDCIEETLGSQWRWIANLKRAVLAGNYEREGNHDMAQDLMDKISETGFWRRWLCRAAFGHTKMGLPGAARLFRPFF